MVKLSKTISALPKFLISNSLPLLKPTSTVPKSITAGAIEIVRSSSIVNETGIVTIFLPGSLLLSSSWAS